MQGQTVIEGSVSDSTGKAVDAYITVSPKGSGNIVGFCDTDAKGTYRMEFKADGDSVIVTAAGLGIGQYTRTVANRPQRVDFSIGAKAVEIKEVSVLADKIRQSGDTVKYNVGRYRQQGDRVIGDVLKRMPGIEVSDGGAIKYNGKAIKKFYVEDMDLLQGRYGLATNNINADDVSRVEVMENHLSVKALQGKVMTDDVAINLKLKNSAKGTVAVNTMFGGGVQHGGGNPLWTAEAVGMYFAKNRQNMTVYKGNNAGDDVGKELTAHYSSINSVRLYPFCPMGAVMPPGSGLPQKRTYDNRTHIVTVNHLEKLSKDKEMTVNLAWQNDHVRREGASANDIFLSDDSRLLTSETLSSLTKSNNLSANIRYCDNNGGGFLANVLKFDGGWNDDEVDGDLSSAYTGRSPHTNSGERVRQQFHRPQFAVSNTLNTIVLSGKNMWNLHFSAGYAQRPNTLTVDVDSLDEGTSNRYEQDLTSQHIRADFNTSYSLRLGDFSLSYGIIANANMHNVRTDLDGFAAPSSDEYDSDNILRNDLWYNTYEVMLGQTYKLERHRWRVSLGCPLNLVIQNLDDRVRHSRQSYSHLLVVPNLSVSYTARNWSGNVNASYNRNVGDSGGIYDGYIMNNYRSFQRSYVDQLSETERMGGSAGVSYRNALNALFFNVSANYSHSHDNQTYGYDYKGATSVVQAVDQCTTTDSYGVNFNASKGFDWMNTTFRLFGGYGGSESERLIAGKVYPFSTENYSLGGGGTITPLSWLNFVVSSGFSWSRSFTDGGGKGTASTVRSSTQRIRVSVFATRELTISASFEDNYNNLTAADRHVWFGDLQAKYKLKRIDLELEANNIFNRKTYTRVSYNGLDIFTSTSQLRPFNVLAKVRFKLL